MKLELKDKMLVLDIAFWTVVIMGSVAGYFLARAMLMVETVIK